MTTIKDKTRAIIAMDRAEVTADEARRAMYHAVRTGEEPRGYLAAHLIALDCLAGARIVLDRVTRARKGVE